MGTGNSASNTPGKKTPSNLDGWIITGVVFFLACGAIAAFLQGRTRSFAVTGEKSRTAKVEGELLDGSADPSNANEPKIKAPAVGIQTLSSGKEGNVEPVPIPPGRDAIRELAKPATPATPVTPDVKTDTVQLLPPPPLSAPMTKAPVAPDKAKKLGDATFQYLTFDTLGGFLYDIPDPDAPKAPGVKSDEKPKDQIPAEIHALNGRKVVLQGYMVPFKVDAEGNVRKFLLVRNQNWCCYGVVPRMNEWVSVTLMNGLKTEVVQDVPLTVYGTLKVGEEIKDNYVVSVYRLEGERVDKDKGF